MKIVFNAEKALTSRGLQSNGKVQKLIDSEVLRLNEPYIPFLTGALKDSGTTFTQIGRGEVVYRTPYARVQYYNNAGTGKDGESVGGRRGKMWFERMKANHKEQILNEAAKLSGGKVK